MADVVAEHGPLAPGWAAAIGAQSAAVLAAAHDLSIVHRPRRRYACTWSRTP